MAVEVVAKKRDTEQRRRGELEVQPERHRARILPLEGEQEQDGCHDAARDNGAREVPPARAPRVTPEVPSAGARCARAAHAGSTPRRGAEIEQAGEAERGQVPKQHSAGRGGGAEEEGRQEGEKGCAARERYHTPATALA